MRKITKEFRTKSGKKVTVKGIIIEKEIVDLDGHKVEVNCNKKRMSVSVDGHGDIDGMLKESLIEHKERYGEEYTHSFGPLLLTEEQANIVRSVFDFIKEDAKKTEDSRGPGWCEKCQSYCYGDCES